MTLQLPILPFPVTFLILSIVMMIRYFFMAGSLFVLVKFLNRGPIVDGEISPHQMKKEIMWSVMSSLVFAFFGALVIEAFHRDLTLIYLNLALYPWWYLPLSLGTYLFLHDTYFYWTHRLLHTVNFKRVHFVHHESRIPSAWTSFAFHPIEAVIQAIILPLLILLIPVHWSVLALFLLIMSVCGALNHLGYELYPLFFEKKLQLISATHHQLHHGKVNYNFGLYFTLWDKWMKTEWEHS